MSKKKNEVTPKRQIGVSVNGRTMCAEITHMNFFGYAVQARTTDGTSISNGPTELTPEWSEVRFNEVPNGEGVPRQPRKMYGRQIMEFHGRMGIEAAHAMAWWLKAALGDVVDVRLVKYEVVCQHQTYRYDEPEEVGTIAQLDGRK